MPVGLTDLQRPPAAGSTGPETRDSSNSSKTPITGFWWVRYLPGPPGERCSALTLAVHARIPVCTLRRMIYAYPTFHRAIEDALDRFE